MQFSIDPIPDRPSELTAGWLNEALGHSGLFGGVSIMQVEQENIGAGMVGDSLRLKLRYDSPSSVAPDTIIAKIPAEDDISRNTGISLGLYHAEVGFYREISETVAVRAPRRYYADINPATGSFLLLLEDLGPARGGNQLAGCSRDDAMLVVRQAAALHGPRWNDSSLKSLGWLNSRPRHLAAMHDIFPAALRTFQDRYDGILEPEYMAVCEEFGKHYREFFGLKYDRFCVMHGDLRLDNLLFDIRGGKEPVAVLDWQTAALATGMIDVAYFLGAGIPSDLRRSNETDLIEVYLDELTKQGVGDYPFGEAWDDYRRGAFQGVVMAIFASTNVERTDRGDAMFLSMARGACQLVIDVAGFSALSSRS